MAIEVETILQSTRDRLRELGEALENLVQSYPDVFEAPEIASQLESFRQAHREATDRLDKPTLAIATLGTTSSGKSTIVNALIGRRIAPIEAGEMSGGVLTLRHADERKLVVEATKGAAWETGEWTDLSDEAIYDRIRNSVMFPYHEIRRERKECIAPEVIAYGPLLAVSNPSLIGLPPGVGVELIDLPGLKSVQDRANLAVIQERVHQAFSLVALDYMQVDDEHRKRLLEELKRVVKYLQGRTDSMIFILNRVDHRGADDIPIEERIDKLKTEIKEVLSLKEPPDIIPFNARLLYYAQCAWGTGSLSSPSLVEQPTRLEMIKFLFRDCAGTINQYTEDNWDLDDWFRDVRRQVSKGENIGDETMRQILRYAFEWSGGSKFWSQLQVRVRESFPELVLLPALFDVFDSYDALSAAIDSIVKIRKIARKAKVKEEQLKIDENRKLLRKIVENTRQEFRSSTQATIEGLKKSDENIRSRLEEQAKKEGRKGFLSLFDAVNEVEGDLTQVLIAPVRDALRNNESSYELEEKLQEFIAPLLAKNIARTYDLASRKLNGFTPKSGYLEKKVIKEDKSAVRELENAERAIRALYHSVKEALSARAEFTLQAQVQKFENALQSLADKEKSKLCTLCLEQFPSLKLDEAAIATFNKNTSRNLPSLPENFFELPNTINQQNFQEKKVVGQETKYYTDKGSCYESQKSKTVDVTKNIEYRSLSLPDVDMMARQWAKGVADGKQRLWDTLDAWIVDYLDRVSNIFDKSVEDVLNLAERALQEQLKIIEENFVSEKQRWVLIEREKSLGTEIRQKLDKLSRTQSL